MNINVRSNAFILVLEHENVKKHFLVDLFYYIWNLHVECSTVSQLFISDQNT